MVGKARAQCPDNGSPVPSLEEDQLGCLPDQLPWLLPTWSVVDAHGERLPCHSKKTTDGHESRDLCTGSNNVTKQSVGCVSFQSQTRNAAVAPHLKQSKSRTGSWVHPSVRTSATRGPQSPPVCTAPAWSHLCFYLLPLLFHLSPYFPPTPRHLAFHETALVFSDRPSTTKAPQLSVTLYHLTQAALVRLQVIPSLNCWRLLACLCSSWIGWLVNNSVFIPTLILMSRVYLLLVHVTSLPFVLWRERFFSS